MRVLRTLPAALLGVALAGCSGSGGLSETGCTGSCQTASDLLLTTDVERVISQAVAEARARGAAATIAVVDRVGNVLAVFVMNGANPVFRVDSGRGVVGGLDGITLRNNGVPGGGLEAGPGDVPFGTFGSAAGAIAKAVTGAYLSSEGNAFTTRTANQIVQEFFNPGERNQPGGPLFGVQFSSLPCSDLNLRLSDDAGASMPGPKRSPLGLAADPGGFPLYKDGVNGRVLVGGVGVVADGLYGTDLRINNRDQDLDELIATAATAGYEPPEDRLADRITVDGKTFRYSDASGSELASSPAAAAPFASIQGTVGNLVAVPGYSPDVIRQGTAFGFAGSGFRRADSVSPGTSVAFAGLDAFVLVDSSEGERFPPRDATDAAILPVGTAPLSRDEVVGVLRGGLDVANRARAQIRRPLDSQVRVTISIVDTNGSILGVARTRDAPVFGTDVSLQKARAAMFFSGNAAGDDLSNTPPANYLTGGAPISFSDYLESFRDSFGMSRLLSNGAIAFGDRSVGNLARPFFPDGVTSAANGPLSKPIGQWSPFSTGIQLDLANNKILQHVNFLLGKGADVSPGSCTEMPDPFASFCSKPGNSAAAVCAIPGSRPAGTAVSRLANGLQIFAGSVPIYRDRTLVGAIGISGDGIDQDDMVAFLGLHNAGLALGGAVGNAPADIRADAFKPRNTRLRYVQCPQAPFLGSDEQNVCQGK